MLSKLFLLTVAVLVCEFGTAEHAVIEKQDDLTNFETSHKIHGSFDENSFHTSHRIQEARDLESLQQSMNLLPSKEKPELNPILSALINEDVMKSIEAKREIEREELEQIKANAILTTTESSPHDDIKSFKNVNEDFVDQGVNLETAESETNKKTRIEIKKGPNGQDYEYEYVYYYEDEDDGLKKSDADDDSAVGESAKPSYTSIDRSKNAKDNQVVLEGSKGRSSSSFAGNEDLNIEPERLPVNTRFPSRGKNYEVQPTPSLESVQDTSAAEKKKIGVKRPSLELVDSDTFNTDEKQLKGFRNNESDYKASIQAADNERDAAIEQEAAQKLNEDSDGQDGEENQDQTTPIMEKAALDLYAILTNENLNSESATSTEGIESATSLPDSTDLDGLTTLNEDEALTTIILTSTTTEAPTTPTTTTTSTTTTTTTTTTTEAPVSFPGRRGSPTFTGRNRYKLRPSSTTTEAPASEPEPTKAIRKFGRPTFTGRNRSPALRKTTPAPSEEAPHEEEQVSVKPVAPSTSSFSRNRPRNRFNVHSTTTTARPADESSDEEQKEAASSTTRRPTRGRLNLRGRGPLSTTTTKAPEEGESANENSAPEESKPASVVPSRLSRFNINRAGINRFSSRNAITHATKATTEATPEKSDEASDEETVEVSSTTAAPARLDGNLNRRKTRPTPVQLPVQRKVNPLIARRPLHFGPSTTEAPLVQEESSPSPVERKDETDSEEDDSEDDMTTEVIETTTKQQLRGLSLLAQRRRLRKPGTLL